MRKSLLLLAFLLPVSGCGSDFLRTPPPPLGARLTADQITASLAGNSMVASAEEPIPLVIYFAENGDLFGLRGNNYKDRGAWTVQDDTVCGAWNNWYGTLSRCWRVYRAGDRFTFTRHDGSGAVVRASLAEGNVAGL